jgi:lipopolysaccharide/colanic/teichoic acid biosynthesis glycosyltransferase
VGYCPTESSEGQRLPKIKKGIYNPASIVDDEMDDEARGQLNVMYARDYTVLKDFNILFRMLTNR